MNPKVYIVILNYLKWEDTIECLESVLRNNYHNYQVIVIDNDSPNNSIYYIKAWIEGKLDVWVNPDNPLKKLSFPPLNKPIPYIYYSQKDAEKGGNIKLEERIYENSETYKTFKNIYTSKYPVILIQSEENRGFSAGNNIGIKYALAKDDFEYIWLLNNDTVIKKDTLTNLINCAESLDKKVSPIGSLLLYYDQPDKIQALGAKFNKFIALGDSYKKNESVGEAFKDFNIKDIDYVVGASMLLRQNFIKEVGLLNEEYFLYFEEIDLAVRGKKNGYRLQICLNSVVYHKEGRTTQNVSSRLSDFFAMRNRMIFTKRYYPYLMPIIYLTYILSILKRIKRKEFKKAYNIIKIMLGKNPYEKKFMVSYIINLFCCSIF